MAQFTDVCRYICFLIKPIIYWHISENFNENLFSLANISVFVMSHANFGYYIHGEIVKDVLLWCPRRKKSFKIYGFHNGGIFFFRKVGSWSCGHGHGRTAGTIAGDNAMTLTNHQHCPSLKTQPAGSGRSLRPPRSRCRLRPPDLCHEPSTQAESLL